MVLPVAVDIGDLIIRTPGKVGGRPRVAGSGVSVQRIVGWYKMGLTPDEIVSEIPHLTLAQIYAALAYYHANHDEIEQLLADEDSTAVNLQRQTTQTLRVSM